MNRMTLILVSLLIPGFVRADDSATIKKFVETIAIAQAGSSEKLNRVRRVEFKSKGTWKTVMGEVIATREVGIDWGEKGDFFSTNVQVQTNNGKLEMKLILEELRRGMQVMGKLSKEMTSEEAGWMSRDVYALWVASLLPLTDEASKLSLLPESKIDGTSVLGLKVERRNRPTVELFFDGKTNLLRKLSYPGLELGVPVKKELVFSDYKEFDGIQMPTKEIEYQDGRRVREWVNSDYRFPDKIDRK